MPYRVSALRPPQARQPNEADDVEIVFAYLAGYRSEEAMEGCRAQGESYR